MNPIRVQTRLVLGALLTAVLVVTGTAATSSAVTQSGSDGTAPHQPVTIAKTDAGMKLAARRCQRPNCWGAIAVNKYTGYWVLAYNYAHERGRDGVRRAVYQACRRESYPSQCATVISVRNGCGATAYRRREDGTVRGWIHSAAGYTVKQAKRKARRAANGAEARAWFCTSRNY
ncbi:DUF4189 domain-containing protein [Nocardioides speluncae]|uniref:DUF4189 domain-containing protein n=1 Tax=Nocardioides speluncae TaxID=2670337 RepID=UPI000D6960F9